MIFYIHGFNSHSTGHNKIKILSKILGEEVYPLNYASKDKYEENILTLKDQINKFNSTTRGNSIGGFFKNTFIGTSLGAFYSAMLAKEMNDTAVLVNPAIEPGKTISKYVGPQVNFKTGEKYEFKQAVADSYPEKILIPDNTLLLLDSEDEVIDSMDTKDKISKKVTRTVIYNGGAHRFEHWEESTKDIKNIIRFNKC